MYLLQYLEIGCQWLHKNSFFITHVVRHKMKICDRESQVFSESPVSIDNTQGGPMWAMGKHVLLTIRTIGAVTGSIDFAYHTLPNQICLMRCSWTFMHGFNNADKFMSQDALEGLITTCDFKIGVTNTSLQDFYQGFPWL